MNIKEAYLELTNRELNLSDFNDLVNFKNECKKQMNQEYLYLADILIIDLYINEGLYDDALTIAQKLVNSIDNVVFQKIYVSLLERLIYIYIQKQNYKTAYRYAFMKRNYIDVENVDEINRWYLEMAYIYAELNQKDKALMNLKAILNNYPNDSLRALTLSNMTKLYIDQQQIEEAKNSLNDCLSLVYKLDDEEGILYCNYLNAKLAILEKNYKHAKHSFQDFFKNITTVTEDYLSIANEYISLLIDMDLYDEAYRFCIKYLKAFEDAKNLVVKKNFYTNYLKIHILKNKNTRDDVRGLLNAIEVLEKEIEKYDDQIINESNEDEKRIEIEDQLNKLISKIEKTISLTINGLNNDNLRNTLINYSSTLEQHLDFDEAVYVIFPIDSFAVVLEVNDDYDKINTYNYKKNRLYERQISFNNLKSTIIEMLISQNHEIMLDLNESILEVKDFITDNNYKDLDVKSLIAIPLFNNNELYGAAIYLSKTNSLNNNDVMTNLKIASKLLEGKLINLFYEENIKTLKAINSVISNNLSTGIFYCNIDAGYMIVPHKLQEFFQLKSRKLNLLDYEGVIVEEDRQVREIIKKKYELIEDYNLEYRIIVSDKQYLVKEVAYPYITRDGVLKFYYGIIEILHEVPIDNNYPKLTKEDFNHDFLEIINKPKDVDYKVNFLTFKLKIDGVDIIISEKILDYVYFEIKKVFISPTYYLENQKIVVIDEKLDIKTIENKVNELFSEFANGFVYDDQVYFFEIKAGLVRYPFDTYNLKEVLDYCDVCLETNEKYQPFNEKLHKQYIKKKSITSCVYEHVKKNKIELLVTPLIQNSTTSGYLVSYNINGLDLDTDIYPYLDSELLIAFEKLIFNTLINSYKKHLMCKLYLKISSKTLARLLSEKALNKNCLDIYRAIVFILDDVDDKVLAELSAYDFSFVITKNAFHSIKITNLLNNNYIRGVYITSEFDNKKYFEFLKLLNYEIISEKAISNYENVKIVQNEKIAIEELFR